MLYLAAAHPENTLFADGGSWGSNTSARWSSSGSSSSPPSATGSGIAPRPKSKRRACASSSSRCFSYLKRQMRLTDHLAKTLPGLVQRIAQRLLALTLGMFCNLLAAARRGRSSHTTVAERASAL